MRYINAQKFEKFRPEQQGSWQILIHVLLTEEVVMSSTEKAKDRHIGRELFAILFWLYVPVKVFLFDIDRMVLEGLFPDYLWLINYRFLIILFTLALILTFVKTKNFLTWLLYALFYPLIVITKLLIRFRKNWRVWLVFFPGAVNFFRDFRLRFIAIGFLSIAILIILTSSSKILVYCSCTIILLFVLVHFALRFKMIFFTKSFFGVIADWILKANTESPFTATDQHRVNRDALIQIPQESEEYMKKRKDNLRQMLNMNNWVGVANEELHSFQKNRTLDLYTFLIAPMYSFFIVILCFSLVYFGIDRVDPFLFSKSTLINPIDFFNLSFLSAFGRDSSILSTNNSLLQLIINSQIFFSMVILISVVAVLGTSFREKFRDDTKRLIQACEDFMSRYNHLYIELYSVTPQQASNEVGFTFSERVQKPADLLKYKQPDPAQE